MVKPRILVLSPHAGEISSSIAGSSLDDVHVSVAEDLPKGLRALSTENFSAVVCSPLRGRGNPAEAVARVAEAAPRTTILFVAERTDGESVREAMARGARAVVFRDALAEELPSLLRQFLFCGRGAAAAISLDDLFEFSIPVLTTMDMALLGGTLLEKFAEVLGGTFGILLRFHVGEDGHAGGLEVEASTGFSDERHLASFLDKYGAGVAATATPQPTAVPLELVPIRPVQDGVPLPTEAKALFLVRYDVAPGLRLVAAVGLRALPGEDVTGSVLLDFFNRQCRFALHNAERNAQAHTLIYIDDLTKLYNNRYLNVILERELKRSERYRNFFSVLFMDIDFFKRINDSHGHMVGSRVLVEVGQILKSCVRETDTVVRYGGDEFVVVLVETNADEAMIVAERMRRIIEARRFGQDLGLNLHFTISIGIASFPEHATTKQHLLNMADQAMYRGKEASRNVVYLARPADPAEP